MINQKMPAAAAVDDTTQQISSYALLPIYLVRDFINAKNLLRRDYEFLGKRCGNICLVES